MSTQVYSTFQSPEFRLRRLYSTLLLSKLHNSIRNLNLSLPFLFPQQQANEQRVDNKMAAAQEAAAKGGVVKVESEESWTLFLSQASNQGCYVLVHFGASWCVPSLAMNGYFEELAQNYQDVLFLVVDVDEVKEVAKRMEIKAMPTFVLMRGTEVISKIVGANPDAITKLVESCLQSTPVPLSE